MSLKIGSSSSIAFLDEEVHGHCDMEEALVLILTVYFSKHWWFLRPKDVESNLTSKQNI
jgi:hypothetical protein